MNSTQWDELGAQFPALAFDIETGLPRVVMSKEGARVELFLQGAHLSDFVSADGQSRLFTSRESRFEIGKPVRGGVPLCFPYFGPKSGDASAPAHGFARITDWQLAGQAPLELILESSDATRALWPHDFAASFRADCTSHALQLGFELENTGAAPFEFEIALHTYFRVSDIQYVEIDGLDGKTYLDKIDGAKRKIQSGAISIEGETDRVYLDSGGPITLRDGADLTKISGNQGWRSTVVWNPWIEKSRALADLGDDEWPGFVCIESGAVADDAIHLGAGEKYDLQLEIGFGSS